MNLEDLDEYVPIVGLNGTGKSNILRALNLFFNGFLDEELHVLDLSRDYPDSLKKAKARKRVAVTVTFDMSTNFAVRGTESLIASRHVGSTFVIERAWTITPGGIALQDALRCGRDLDHLEEVNESERLTVLSFIRAVHFRYVPNHVRPSDFIGSAIQPLRKTLMTRLARTSEYKAASIADAMEALSRVAGKMLEGTSDRISSGTGGGGISADVPSDFGDLAFQIAVQTLSESGPQPTELQGSGTQSFVLLHVLALLDKTEREQGFGWRQASIWALEEPESFLHAGLRARFSKDARDYAVDPRRQIFCTTHEDDFVRVGDNAWLIQVSSGQSTAVRLSARDALAESAKQRITSFRHPLVESLDQPLVLVEGKWDAVHLLAAYESLGLRPRWKLASLADIEPDMTVGGSSLATYLKMNQSVVKSRPLTAPILIIRDWEDAGSNLSSFQEAIAVHENSQVLVCDPSLTNPELDKTFKGIERYLATELIQEVFDSSELGRPSNSEVPLRMVADKNTYTLRKKELAEKVLQGQDPGQAMTRLATWIDEQVKSVLSGVPVQMFLGLGQ